MQSPVLPFSNATDAEVTRMLAEHRIGLSVAEVRKVTELLGRDPTLVEATIFGIQGSEHCSYKSSRRFLKTLPTTGRHVILGPGEDSGIVAMTDEPPGKRWGLVISHESHNHPSQVVPYEGAATGVGGAVRDVLCMGARVIGCMDMLRLGDLKTEETRAIAREVTRGIAGYGNPLGVPNLGGDTAFDAANNGNCLVNALAVGIVREDEVIHSTVPEEAGSVGYDIILVGKPTDRSGFGGAAFASATIGADAREEDSGAVQEPNPFLERHILVSTYALFDWLVASGNLHRVSFKDLGAGGAVCASVEQVVGRNFGARVELTKIHTSIKGLPPEVIACAETQERMCWVCHPDLTAHILAHYNETWDLPSIAEYAGASVIGTVTVEPNFVLTHEGTVVCDVASTVLTSGFQYVRPIESPPPSRRKNFAMQCTADSIEIGTVRTTIPKLFEAICTHPNGASRWPIVQHYDKTVVGNTLVEAGEADASIIAPFRDLPSYIQDHSRPAWDALKENMSKRGIALSVAGIGRYGRLSPFAQGAHAIAESVCNVAAVGATPRAITDCLNYGNPEDPVQLWALSEGVRGLGEAARALGENGEAIPIISGNVSLYNTTASGGGIDPTAIVSCIGMVEDVTKTTPMHLSEAPTSLLILGALPTWHGASMAAHVIESLGGLEDGALLGTDPPPLDLPLLRRTIDARMEANAYITACHDVSEGGIALGILEMLAAHRGTPSTIGCALDLSSLPSSLCSATALFGETRAFIIAVQPKNIDACMAIAKKHDVPCTPIGSTTPNRTFDVMRDGTSLCSCDVDDLEKIRQESLRKALRGPGTLGA